VIRLVNGMDYVAHGDELDQMFRLRKRVFADRLGWNVSVYGEYEIDSYDMLKPLYVLSMDDQGKRVLGSLRLLPTTGPNMLADTFLELMPDNKPYRSSTVWESSRYCVDTEVVAQDAQGMAGSRGLHYATTELLLALCEVGMVAGLTFIVTVIDLRMERVLRRINCMGERIGAPKKYGDVMALAGLWETSPEMLQQLREASGISDSVLENPQSALSYAA
jgi:acyl homoserine lactone synthase